VKRRAHLKLQLVPFVALSAAIVTPVAFGAEDETGIRFRKSVLSKRFLAEGVAVADVDGDGKKDILAGALWFQAPEWKAHEIAAPQDFVPHRGYSDSFLCYTDELSGDGRPDYIVVGFPGEALRIYENPGTTGAHWPQWEAAKSIANESPMYVDLSGDGRPELLCGSDPNKGIAGRKEEHWVGWFEPRGWKEPWAWRPVAGPESPGGQRFSHGIGRGDVNGDGRTDILIARGWYEAPADSSQVPWLLHAFPDGIRDRPSAQMYVLDIDGDEDGDVLASSAHDLGIWWYEQVRGADGAIGWKDHSVFAETLPEPEWFTQTHSLVVADINGDGLQDFVTGKRWFAHQGHDRDGRNPIVPIYWFELRREGSGPRGGAARWVAHLIDDNCGVGTQFVVDDVNGDGKLDVVVSNKKGVRYLEQD
jgi:hypothetical protein